jgi:asparagine synthetase B (glutamine-hydrolysing)
MNSLRPLLRDYVAQMSSVSSVALSLSAGLDSITTGIVCEEAGKHVQAYTFELQGYKSRERDKVEVIARHFGWPLKVITVPTRNVAADFKRLAIQFHCKTKVHFEVLFPLLYVFPEIEEHEVWTGFNADDHYGNTRKVVLEMARLTRKGVDATERKRRFDEIRADVYRRFDEPGSTDSWWPTKALAAHFGKVLLDPYIQESVRDIFRRFDHDQLAPLDKPIIRQAFADRLEGLPVGAIAKGERLQKSSRVDELFLTLLSNQDINRF